jgi:hypothetical protein
MSTKPAGQEPSPAATPSYCAGLSPLCADALEPILQKLKLLEFGLFGLQQFGRNASLDVEDIGPFYRLAEEIGGDVLTLQRRLESNPTGGAIT